MPVGEPHRRHPETDITGDADVARRAFFAIGGPQLLLGGQLQIGLLTGDTSVNSEAPIVVMTTEVLRNMIYASSHRLDDLGVVVLDEVHYLQDAYRGPVWEEVIIQLDPEVQLVCLSATVSNADEVGEWLSTVRGRTDVVVETTRPI